MEKIEELAKLFAKYKIYPKSCYDKYSPVKVFQRMFPENHYSKDLGTFLSYQNYKPVQRGADLSWWGKNFFTGETGRRVLIVSQDSNYKDAGSVVLAAFLFPVVNSSVQYQKFVHEMDVERYFGFSRYKRIKDQLIEWGIDLDFLYITDASKVYKSGSWENEDFDREKSKKLLESEIEFCKPNLIILLGAPALRLLDGNKKYSEIVESGKYIYIKGIKSVVSPFFIGNGIGQPNFDERLKTATRLIKKLMKKK